MRDIKEANELRVDLERIKRDILELAAIGYSEEDRGIYRMAFTEADMEGKRWLRERICEAELEESSDGAGNVFGRLAPDEREAAERPSVLMGSHIDTVPCAGALDGSLGVVVALECLRTIRSAEVELAKPLEMVAFSDEEGRFGGMFGSEAFCGRITPDTLHKTDLNGITLESELRRRGYEPMRALEAARRKETLDSYLELHIEQGPVLDRTGRSAGIVDTITGLFKWQVRFRGEANHAGTTPMSMRNDAFMGLADFAHEIQRLLDENGSERSRATIGKAEIRPGAPNTVPGLVDFSLDVRDTGKEVLEELKIAFRKALSSIARRRDLKLDLEELSFIAPIDCDGEIVETLRREAEALDLRATQMPSGAAHDAQILGNITRIGMLFAPSRGGRSHTPEEWTSWEDIEACANLSLRTLLRMAGPGNR